MVSIVLILLGIIVGIITGVLSDNPYIGLGIAATIEFGALFTILEDADKKQKGEIEE
jgi:hypothetical protein